MASSPSSSEISPKSEPISPNSSPTPLSLTITNSRPSTNEPPARASAHKKDKKNVREKRRRGELNRKFDTLRELLSIGEGKSKVEKSHILSEAISAIESLKKRNHELIMIVSQYSSSGSGPSSATLARNPLLSQSSSGSSSLNLSPFMNMLPNMSSNADPASVAGSTLLAQMSANQFQRPHNSQPPSSSNQNPLSQSSHSAFLNQLQSLIPNQSMSLNNPPGASNTPTPLPYGGGSNQQQQSFPSFAGQQMSPSLAFTQQLQQQFAQQQQIQQQFQQMQHQQHSNSMSGLNNNNSNQQNMLGLPSTSQSITRGSSHASINDPHSINQQQHR